MTGPLWRGALAWLVVAAVVRLVVVQPERCGDPSPDDVRAAAGLAVDWLVRNQRPDGSWLYRYDRAQARDLRSYNTVRHAGVIASLEQAATAGHAGAAASADHGTAWALRRTVAAGGGRALADDPASAVISSGATALWAAGLVERRERTGDQRHDELLVELGRFLESMVTPRGAVLGRFDRRDDAPVPESWSKFYTGEVFWALAALHRALPDAGFDEPALRIAHYLATERDQVEGWWPTIPDHWAAYGFATVATWPERAGDRPLDPVHVEYLRHQAALQSAQIRYESQRTGSWWTHLTRGRPTLGAGLGTIGEALDQLWVVAGRDERLADLRPAIAERARCTAGVMVARQVDEAEARAWPEPRRAAGAFFQFDVTQMDDQQHTLSALLGAEAIVGQR